MDRTLRASEKRRNGAGHNREHEMGGEGEILPGDPQMRLGYGRKLGEQ